MSFIGWIRDWFGAGKPGEEPLCPPDARADEDDIDPFNPFPEPIVVEIGDVIDLHTIPPADVKRVVEAYLVEAANKGFRTVRIIHGKGIGVQREMVRTILARTPFVLEWTDAPPDAGGLGATLAHLDPSKFTSED